jgi:hypothetical protein
VACPYPGTSSGEDNAKRVAYAQSVRRQESIF